MSELMDLFDDAKQIIEKQEKLINAQRNLIETMQMALSGIEMNELLLKKQLGDLQEELKAITNDYIDNINIYKGGA
jgi:PIN domain nuclease of toxin-antitoxin system